MWHSWGEFGSSPSDQKICHVSTKIIYPDDIKGKKWSEDNVRGVYLIGRELN